MDDEPIILRTCTIALAAAGFRTVVAENGIAGLEVYTQFPGEIALVLADIVMPSMNGIEMAERIKAIDPAARILLMSGYSDNVLEFQGRRDFPFIRKPFIHTLLIERIRTLIGSADAAASSE